MAGYRLRGVPLVGSWLEKKVREDDLPMVNANFVFPEGYDRVTGNIGELTQFVNSPESSDR
jgi:hypothetical protein